MKFYQTIYIRDAFLADDIYNPGIYSFKLYNITYNVPTLERYYSEKPIIIEIFNDKDRLIE